VTNFVLIAQILISAALMASILLQSRGAGLGATFGGDSSVYRSRRGIEKRLFQFTIILAIVFCITCFASFLLVGTPGS
jgi:preprotein translocase subunit SecG